LVTSKGRKEMRDEKEKAKDDAVIAKDVAHRTSDMKKEQLIDLIEQIDTQISRLTTQKELTQKVLNTFKDDK
jgi:hypothetical protein